MYQRNLGCYDHDGHFNPLVPWLAHLFQGAFPTLPPSSWLSVLSCWVDIWAFSKASILFHLPLSLTPFSPVFWSAWALMLAWYQSAEKEVLNASPPIHFLGLRVLKAMGSPAVDRAEAGWRFEPGSLSSFNAPWEWDTNLQRLRLLGLF